MKQENQQNIKIAVLEEKMNSIEEKIDQIMTNDLVHLKDDISNLRWYISVGIGILMTTEFFIKFLLK